MSNSLQQASQSIFRVTSLNHVSKKRQDQKINQENERLLKKIVEITFRRKKSSLGMNHGPASIDHQELAFRPYQIKQYHSGEQMRRNLKRIKEENREYFSKLSNISKDRENSPGFITNRKLEYHQETARELKKNVSKIYRSPLNSGTRATLYFPSLRSSFNYQQQRLTSASKPEDGGLDQLLQSRDGNTTTSGINEFIDSSLDNISVQVKRRLETSRSKRVHPLILSKDFRAMGGGTVENDKPLTAKNQIRGHTAIKEGDEVLQSIEKEVKFEIPKDERFEEYDSNLQKDTNLSQPTRTEDNLTPLQEQLE